MNSHLKINRNSGIQCLMYFAFHIADKYPVDSVAEKMGVHVDSLYRWINGTNVFPAEQIINLTNATTDIRYLEFIADKCGYRLIPKIKNRKCAEMMKTIADVFLSASGEEKEKSDE